MKAEIVGDADSGTVTLAVAVRTVRLCYLEGSHTRPPIACRRLLQPVRGIGESLPSARIPGVPGTRFASGGP